MRSYPAVSREIPPSPATGEGFKLGHYRVPRLSPYLCGFCEKTEGGGAPTANRFYSYRSASAGSTPAAEVDGYSVASRLTPSDTAATISASVSWGAKGK